MSSFNSLLVYAMHKIVFHIPPPLFPLFKIPLYNLHTGNTPQIYYTCARVALHFTSWYTHDNYELAITGLVSSVAMI